MSWFSKWFRRVMQKANSIWRSDIAPAVQSAWEKFSNEFESLAYDTVTALALSQLTGSQKFDEAVKVVLAEAKKRGWEIGTSAVQLLVQRAYVNFKATTSEGFKVVEPGFVPKL
jgi:hypothetical protein